MTPRSPQSPRTHETEPVEVPTDIERLPVTSETRSPSARGGMSVEADDDSFKLPIPEGEEIRSEETGEGISLLARLNNVFNGGGSEPADGKGPVAGGNTVLELAAIRHAGRDLKLPETVPQVLIDWMVILGHAPLSQRCSCSCACRRVFARVCG